MSNRSAPRYSVHAPVLFEWSTESNRERGVGFTRDISVTGAYIVCESNCNVGVGQPMWLDVLLPSLSGSAEGVRFIGEGKVVRAAESNEQRGFAIAADFHFPALNGQ